MVTRLLRLDAPPKPADAADALALAICHVWRGGTKAKLERGGGRRQKGRPKVIASVSGVVAAVSPDGAVVEVGGVGLAVHCAPGTLAGLRVGEQARLATSLVVREDSLTLYGFADDDEKHLFELLQTASGVGPRLAQAVLAVHHPDVVRKAIATGDTATLTRVPGIGKKGAERLVLELRDRIGPIAVGADGAAGRGRRGLARPGPAGPGRARLDGRAGRPGGGRGRPRRSTATRRPVPVLLKQAIQLLRPDPMTTTSLGDAGRDVAEGEQDAEATVRPEAAGRVHRPAPGPRAAGAAAAGRDAARHARRTTSCCPGRPGWARPPWP